MNYPINFFDNVSYSDIFGGLLLIIIGIFLALVIVYIVGLVKVFQKGGKPGWACIVPFYGNWVLVELAGLHWVYFIMLIANSIAEIIGIDELSFIASLASLYGSFACAYNISKKFGKGVGFSIFLFLFGIIGYPILGFSKKLRYDNNIPVSEHAFLGNNKTPNQNDTFKETNDYEYNNNECVYCANCGTQLNKDIRFCPNCGKERI